MILIFDHEKFGGDHINTTSTSKFLHCMNECNLINLGANGPKFTWLHGVIREWLDMELWKTQEYRGLNFVSLFLKETSFILHKILFFYQNIQLTLIKQV